MTTFKLSALDFPIKSVTIYKSRKAEIVRSFPIELKAGQNSVEITNISSTIDPLSVRVTGLGDSRLFDVVCKLGTNKAAVYAPDGPIETIRHLMAKKAELMALKANRDSEADILNQYARTITGEFVTPPQMAQFLQSYVEQGRKNAEAVAALTEQILDVERSIEAEAIKAALKQGTAAGEVTAVIRSSESMTINMLLTYMVSDVKWFPTYELYAKTDNGKPVSQVHLHYRARIVQRTGEDWTDAQLTLNTSESDLIGQRIPLLHQVKLRQRGSLFHRNNNIAANANLFTGKVVGSNTGFPQQGAFPSQQVQFPQQVQSQQQQRQFAQPMPTRTVPSQNLTAFGSTSAPWAATNVFGSTNSFAETAAPAVALFGGGSSAFGASAPPPPPPAPTPPAPESVEDAFEEVALPLLETPTTVTETPLAVSYAVDGRATIPSDGVEHQVAVAILPFESTISYITVPRADPRLFLQCQVKNTSEYRLLPGPVRVIVDDSFVSHTNINDVVTGDTFDCTLGHDSTAKVTYTRNSRTERSRGGAFAESFKTTTITTTIVIHNKHSFAVNDLTVRESIPLSEDSQVKVLLRKPAGLETAKDGQEVDLDGSKVRWQKLVDEKGGEKEGKFEWKSSVEASSKLSLEAQWDVKSPADFVIEAVNM